MIGPRGYGPAGFVAAHLVFEYKIRFENEANATAPAQNVLIDHDINKNLDLRTFRLNSFGFGDYVKDLSKQKRALYQPRVREIIN